METQAKFAQTRIADQKDKSESEICNHNYWVKYDTTIFQLQFR